MPFDQCWVQKFSASNLFLLAPRVANSAWAGSACMSKTDAQSGPVALSKLKCCKNSNLDGKTMENHPILPRVRSSSLEKKSLSHVFFCSWWAFCWVFFWTSNIIIHKTTPKSVSNRSTLQVFLGICEFSRIFETQKKRYNFSVSPRMPIQAGRSFSPLSTQRECHGENFQWQDPETWAMFKKRGTLVV